MHRFLMGGLQISSKNRKTRVILLKTRVGTGTRVVEKIGFKIIPNSQSLMAGNFAAL